ncbi:bifunctional class I SAM-dependent methyltransferase/glycosyltransferase family 2 protein [Alphaproteobacteria bacterium]|nr:bifunctional class I SAM-dependent methyltransferase/glycosyltransferase family 2 protein [Alphaproteobacteria bacterium]
MLNRKKMINDFFNSPKLNRDKWLKKGKTFHAEDIRFLKEIIPEKSNILELGCGNGHLLSSLKPNYGLGIDFSKRLVKEAKKKYSDLNFIEADIENLPKNLKYKIKFDFVIICDTVGYLEDITETLDNLHIFFNEDTRLIVSYYSPLWAPFLNLAALLKLKMSNINSTLLGTSDIFNFLDSSKFQTVRIDRKILIPFYLFGLERLINRYIAPLPLFSSICLRHYNISRSLKVIDKTKKKSASVIIPCKNERGNIANAIERLPKFTDKIEVIFAEGNSSDGTWEEIKKVIKENKVSKNKIDIKAFKQPSKGKADAVFFAFDKASNDILIILDGDLTVAPETLKKFWKKICSGEAEYVNGSRLIYPMDNNAMRFLNYIANKLFSILFTWLLGQRFTDTLCGTKVISKKNYLRAKKKNKDLGNFDPFGDFFLIFGASRLCLKINEVPIRYKAREYGETQISRFSHGVLLIKMLIFAFFKIKAI